MKTKNQTGLKNFKPKINLNHNIYAYVRINIRVCAYIRIYAVCSLVCMSWLIHFLLFRGLSFQGLSFQGLSFRGQSSWVLAF